MPIPPRPSHIDRSAILEDYFASCTPVSDRVVGVELERHVLSGDGRPTPYFGEHGIGWLLDALASDRGWTPKREGENTIALKTPGGEVTLEPGSQLEFSSAPRKTVAELATLADDFTATVDRLYRGADRHQVSVGFTPFADIADIPWTPKARYAIMQQHLIARGPLAHHMMKGTCAVQAAFDYTSEAHCAQMVRLSSQLGPLVTALYANSPYAEGRDTGMATFRGKIWTQTDPVRTGFPAVSERFGFEPWVDWLLDVPMMFTAAAGRWRPAEGRTFRQWLTHGIDGAKPTWDDWDLHLTSVFPEVRVKHFVEVRGADAVPAPLALAFAALFEGLFYDDDALAGGLELADRFSEGTTTAHRFDLAVADGLGATVAGRRYADWAQDLCELAHAGLGRVAPGDQAFLAPLVSTAASGHSPGHALRAALGPSPSPAGILARCATGFANPSAAPS